MYEGNRELAESLVPHKVPEVLLLGDGDRERGTERECLKRNNRVCFPKNIPSLACGVQSLIPVLPQPLSCCMTLIHLSDAHVFHLLIGAHYNSVSLPLGVCEG